MKAARAASLSAPIIYAPGTSFDLNVTFPVDDYDLTGKWMTFDLRKSKTGSIVFRLDETSAALTISSQTGSIAIEPDTANGISGGPTLGDIAKGDQTLFFSVDFGDDTDTDLAEYRLQGDITVITEQGAFADTSAVTSVTPTFENASITVNFLAKGDTGASGSADPFWVEVVLTASGADISSGAKVATLTHTVAGTITGFKLVCDPANEPSASSVQVDMNAINLSTGASTSRLSAVAQIATSANVSTGGTISGTQTVAFGDQTSFDIDQGSDGKELRALVQITPS